MNNANPFDVRKLLESMQESGQRMLGLLQTPDLPGSAGQLHAAWAKAFGQEPATMAAWQTRLAGLQQLAAGSESPSARDKRFQGNDWQQQPAFKKLADSYVATSQMLLDSLDDVALAPAEKKRARFFLKQYLDAVSPSNFLATNPEALRLAYESRGGTLKQGAENLSEDIAKGHVSITDETAFEVGVNIAVSPGAIVFENALFQLIQYSPTTRDVYMRPMLFVPPCINKFYILDLTPENSLIRYLVSEGHTVFVMSWRNVDASQGHLTWDHYVADGVVKAIDTVRLITNVDRINTLGFCVGGTLLATALAVLRRLGHDVVASNTFLTTFIDFTDVGDIDAYIDEAFMAKREREVGESAGGGIVNGAELAFAFSSLRANDLIWSYVVNNYLKGVKPPAFDLLYWNADSTNLPGPWYCWYVRNTYVENNMIHPDRVAVCGTPVDMSYVDMPSFVFAAREDHIVPWRSAYQSAATLGGEVSFTLGASGHIAGVVNPASKNKRSYWSNDSVEALHETGANAWLDSATESPGSWWTRWSQWLQPHGGRRIAARERLGSAQFKVIEPAPGRYVRERN